MVSREIYLLVWPTRGTYRRTTTIEVAIEKTTYNPQPTTMKPPSSALRGGNIIPKPIPALKLVTTGATVGPLVDSLHNQCLLKYDRAPIDIISPFPFPPSIPIPAGLGLDSDSSLLVTSSLLEANEYLLRTSWFIPPLLGVAYLVLGSILPRIISTALDFFGEDDNEKKLPESRELPLVSSSTSMQQDLRAKAILAVTSTALIIKLSETLETTPFIAQSIQEQVPSLLTLGAGSSEINLIIMALVALVQWRILDGTLAALITGVIVSIGGPLSEIPFIASGFWEYLPSASDYHPLESIWTLSYTNLNPHSFLSNILGDFDYRNVSLSSITGPCYFAVTMDAIALGRWFDNDEKIEYDR